MSADARKPLADKIAVVAGATRGAGRGIATMLGAAGATVYCTGRSTRGNPATPGRAETIEETAELVTAAGGTGIAVRVDHTIADEVRALFERVERDYQRLDILVNDIWGGDELTEWGRPFWKLDPAKGLRMQELAVQTHILTARFGAPLMVKQKSGLIVEVTDGMFLDYRGNLFYDLAKISAIRLAYAMAAELRRHQGRRAGADAGVPPLGSDARRIRRDAKQTGATRSRRIPISPSRRRPPMSGARSLLSPRTRTSRSKRERFARAGRSRRSTGSPIQTAASRTGARISRARWLEFSNRGGPSNTYEELRVWSRYEQIRDDPRNADEAARLAAALSRAGVSILP